MNIREGVCQLMARLPSLGFPVNPPRGWEPASAPKPDPRTAAEIADETMELLREAVALKREQGIWICGDYLEPIERATDAWVAAKAREAR